MYNIKIYSALSLIILFLSCNLGKKGIEVSVKNSTEHPLYNIRVIASSDSYIIFDTIAPNEAQTKFLDMSKTPQSDGSYTLKFTRTDGKEVSQSTGYYTNGTPLNNTICYGIDDISISTFFDDLCH